jgi:hypothetical protein
MKLVAQVDGQWRYLLEPIEADILVNLVKQFPFTAPAPSAISRTDDGAAAEEREQLLAESLAEHRQQLQLQAATLLAGDKWRASGQRRLLTLEASEREFLLQLLNDIRVGSWQALGQPDGLSFQPTTEAQRTSQNLMDLAGYFEMNLLEPEA